MDDIDRMTRAAGAMTAGEAREVLGLSPGADADALGRAYRAAVKTAHPDRGGGDAERLRQVIEARRVLQALGEARMVFTPAPRPPPVKGQSLSLKITVREALFGGRRRVTPQSGPALDVRLPKGLRPGDLLRLAAGTNAGGDVMVRISLQGETGLSVRGDDLWLEVNATSDQLRAGARLEVDTPRGRRALTAPEGAADGRAIRLKGQGLPARGRHPVGDLILKLCLQSKPEEPASKTLLKRFSARWAA
ncbi:MAG TPA: DnaJ C-terminal domain-containing protein [Caulobacteraceae bacterium]